MWTGRRFEEEAREDRQCVSMRISKVKGSAELSTELDLRNCESVKPCLGLPLRARGQAG